MHFPKTGRYPAATARRGVHLSTGIVSRRLVNAAAFVVCVLVMAYAYFLEYQLELPPCPLCTLQRIAMAALGTLFVAAALHDPGNRGARAYAALMGLVAAAGAAVAGRHVWLQYFSPDEQASTCLPGLDFLLKTMPLGESLRLVLFEAGACTGIDWTFLGLSIPVWTLILFLGLGTLGGWRNWRRD